MTAHLMENIMSRFTNDMDNISAAIQAIYTQVFLWWDDCSDFTWDDVFT